MSDAEAYLRRGKRIQSQKFGRAGVARNDGSASESGEADAPSAPLGSSSVVIVRVDDAARETRLLPMKKKKKRSRSDSDEEESDSKVSAAETAKERTAAAAPQHVAEELELTAVASPSSPVPPVEGVAQRISLLSKWFPAVLLEDKLDAALAPSTEFVEATTERMNKARDYVLALRYGIEDMETALKATRDTQAAAWQRAERDDGVSAEGDKRVKYYWELSGSAVARLTRRCGVTCFKEALAEFADEVPVSTSEVATAVYAVVRRRRRLRVPLDYHPKGWHDLLDTRGPEAGVVPHLSDVMWLSVAGVTSMFATVAQRLLRGARALTTPAGKKEEDTTAVDGHRFFDNTEEQDGSKAEEKLAPSSTIWIAKAGLEFAATLSSEQKAVLAFLRFLMPVSMESASGRRGSVGLGVWLYAAFTALDTPLDPDTARLAHDLFRTCCRHLRTLGAWKGVRGGTRDALLSTFPTRRRGTAVMYTAMEEVAKEDVLALYTVVVVLARFFRQNQDLFIPL